MKIKQELCVHLHVLILLSWMCCWVNIYFWPWNNILIQKCNLDNFPTAKPKLNHEQSLKSEEMIDEWHKQQTLILSLNFTKIINLFFKYDWLITMLFQGRNMSHLVKTGSACSHTGWFRTLIRIPATTLLLTAFCTLTLHRLQVSMLTVASTSLQ